MSGLTGRNSHLTLGLVALLLTCALSARAAGLNYEATAAAIDINRIAGTIRTFEGYGSRVVGYPGNAQSANYILAQFHKLRHYY